MPSGVFTASAAWLVLAVIAFNLLRAAGKICGNDHARATTSTLRHKIIAVLARIASSARKHRLHLPTKPRRPDPAAPTWTTPTNEVRPSPCLLHVNTKLTKPFRHPRKHRWIQAQSLRASDTAAAAATTFWPYSARTFSGIRKAGPDTLMAANGRPRTWMLAATAAMPSTISSRAMA